MLPDDLYQERDETLMRRWEQGSPTDADSIALYDVLIARGLEPAARGRGDDEGLTAELEGSNARVTRTPTGKRIIRFPDDGFMTLGRFEFDDEREFWRHALTLFGGSIDDEGGTASFSRRGQYRRVDDAGASVFTFGDPVLDACTNRHGLIIIGGRSIDVRAQAIESANLRSGVLTRQLSSRVDEIEAALLTKSLGVDPELVLLSCDESSAAFATRNPSQLVFTIAKGGLVIATAWRVNYFFYWSAGAAIHVLGPPFAKAHIVGRYGVLGGSSVKPCQLIAQDEDVDTNDTYMDEWEAGSFWSMVPDGVSSRCRIQMPAQEFAGTVSKGSCGANI